MADEESPADEKPTRLVEVERVDPLSLEEAFSIVGQETRTNIVLELGAARADGGVKPEPLAFSELMERVGVEDSGRFNYHLDKLVGSFVERTDEGYVLRLPGQLLYRAIVAGTLTDRRTVEPFPVGTCPDCDGELSAVYHPDHVFAVECLGCDTLVDAVHFPACGVDAHGGEDLLDAVYQRRALELGTMHRGVCHACGGRVDRSIRPAGVGPVPEACHCEYLAVLTCEACSASVVANPAIVALTTPVVVGFFADHGRDATLVRNWEDPVAAAADAVEFNGEPMVAETVYEIDGERLRVVLDDDLQVAESERA